MPLRSDGSVAILAQAISEAVLVPQARRQSYQAMPDKDDKVDSLKEKEPTRVPMVICDGRPPGTFTEAQKKLDFFTQLLGSEKKK
mmetsp:Transcript_11354/g.8952  ORF Transcript_11354/g.8952 Transcript_11354/m.8952 type:complete len:85 (+) Transcript_11354:31-285(+)